MARMIDINERNKSAIAAAQVKALRALGAIRGVGELSRGYVPLSEEQVNKIHVALTAEVNNAHKVLLDAVKRTPEGAATIDFTL